MRYSLHYQDSGAMMLHRSFLAVAAIGVVVIVSVAIDGFRTPPPGLGRLFTALLQPDSGSSSGLVCPEGHHVETVGQTQSEPPTTIYDCVPDGANKTACAFYACGHADCEGSVMPVSCTDPR